jgi:hypothetical protein
MSKFALLIGINYYNTENQLYGCINDVIMMRKYLIEHKGYLSENISVLRDDNTKFSVPNKINIMNEISNLIQKANLNNSSEIFFHYSGHGTYMKDTKLNLNDQLDEKDKRDEYICPVDLDCISDDQMRNELNKLNNNTILYSVMDCCHSGTNLDLPYTYSCNNNKLVIFENNSSVTVYKNLLTKKIYSISGCRDDQTSADAYNVYQPYTDPSNNDFTVSSSNLSGGALTSCLLQVLKVVPIFTNVLPSLYHSLSKSYYDQKPNLSSSIYLLPISPKKPIKNKKKPNTRPFIKPIVRPVRKIIVKNIKNKK